MTAAIEAASATSSRDAGGNEPIITGPVSARLSPRGQVDEAFAFDRGATRLLYLAETRLVQTETDLAVYVDPGDGTDRSFELTRAIDAANAELKASMDYRAQCREALSEALDGLAACGTENHDGRSSGFSSSSAAAAVVAEATAIAAIAEQTLANELHFAAVQAAKTAEEAVAAAAATVANAAEVSRRTRRVAADLAAADVAAEAAATAANVQVHADAVAADTADQSAAAALIVASAVATDAVALAAITSAAAAATEHVVFAAAAAVQSVAEAAARDFALPTAPGLRESATQVSTRRAADARHAAMDAIATTSDAAQHARTARLTAATLAAATVAQAAELTAHAVQTRAEELADNVASSALAADLVARSVAATAEAMAARIAAEELVIEQHVRGAALALQAITKATAVQLASVTLEREAAVAVAKRAAAVANERLREADRQLESAHRHDRAVALALQQAMLSPLPRPAGMTMASKYLSAVEQDRVGGDWYDALLLPSGAVTLMVGDVIGHDIAAAAMMSQLRSVLRTLVWEDRQPTSSVVGRLDAVMRDLHLDTLASLILVNVDNPMTSDGSSVATLRWSNAGHPAPILLHADGTAVILDDATDMILGVQADAVRQVHEYAVTPGATLLLYTDGLIESRTQDQDQGRQRLLDTVRAHHRLDLDELLDTVLTDMIDNHADDDVAVLAVRFGTEPLSVNPAPTRASRYRASTSTVRPR